MVFGYRLLAVRNDTNHVAGRDPIDLITWTDLVLFGNSPRHRDLILGCDFGHVLILARVKSLLTPSVGAAAGLAVAITPALIRKCGHTPA